MSRPIQHLLLFALAVAAGAGVLAWGDRVGALRQIEAAFSRLIVAAALAPPYLLESGAGPNEAWVARRLAPPPPTGNTPQFLGIGDDPQRVFESSPPSAGDYAVILSQLQRQQHRKVAISLPMAWDDADSIALAALDDELAAFPLALCASPLGRGISPQPIPPAFARASVATTLVTGNPRLLPVVNRTAHASVMLGSRGTLAGFTLLENEDPPDFARHEAGEPIGVALLARWDDRVVLSFPLLVAMAHAGIAPAELVIHLGEFIRLGQNGAVIPIDSFGRFQLPPGSRGTSAEVAVAAEALIEALVSEEASQQSLAPRRPPIILRDERHGIHGAEADFAKRLSGLIGALAASPQPGGTVAFMRPPGWMQFALLLPLAGLSAMFLRLGRLSRMAAILVTAALTVILLLMLGQQLNLTPSVLPAMVVLATAMVARTPRRAARRKRDSLETTTHS